MKIIGIAGGSGSGKSTTSYHLVDRYPENFDSINLDDYQRLKTDPSIPMIDSMINWDHPDVIQWDALAKDLESLKNGNSISIDTWSHRSNSQYHLHGKMLTRVIAPRPFIIVEGYLSLYDEKVNTFYDHTFYFDLDEKTRNSRRDKNQIIANNDYEKLVLIPMHEKFVEPTKKAAENVIDVSGKTVDEICDIVVKNIENGFD